MVDKILGIQSDTFYGLMFLLLLIILGIVSFHYYAYVKGGNGAALRAGAGVGFAIFPKEQQQMQEQQMQEQQYQRM